MKWRDIRCSLHGSFHRLARARCELRGWMLNEVNGMLANLFHGNCWEKRVWRDIEGQDNKVRLYFCAHCSHPK